MRKIILNLAISIDGMIADVDGGFSWIKGQDDKSIDTIKQFDFSRFSNSCDTIVMGRKAYDDCGIENIEDFENKMFYVATTHDRQDSENVKFIKGDIVKLIVQLQQLEGKNIWLFGGSGLTDAFVQANVIDEYIVGIIPTIRGTGTKLFADIYPVINLDLKQFTVNDGIVILEYVKRK